MTANSGSCADAQYERQYCSVQYTTKIVEKSTSDRSWGKVPSRKSGIKSGIAR